MTCTKAMSRSMVTAPVSRFNLGANSICLMIPTSTYRQEMTGRYSDIVIYNKYDKYVKRWNSGTNFEPGISTQVTGTFDQWPCHMCFLGLFSPMSGGNTDQYHQCASATPFPKMLARIKTSTVVTIGGLIGWSWLISQLSCKYPQSPFSVSFQCLDLWLCYLGQW